MVARRSSGPRQAVVRSWDAVGRDLVRSGVTWRVHSVFRAAFNLVSDRRELLGIVTAPASNGPATLLLAASDVTSTVRPGDAATLVGQRLVIGDRLALDLSRAALWDPPPIRRALSFGEILDRLELAVGVAAARAPSAGLAPLLTEARRLAGGAAPSPWERGHPGRPGSRHRGGQDGRAPR